MEAETASVGVRRRGQVGEDAIAVRRDRERGDVGERGWWGGGGVDGDAGESVRGRGVGETGESVRRGGGETGGETGEPFRCERDARRGREYASAESIRGGGGAVALRGGAGI